MNCKLLIFKRVEIATIDQLAFFDSLSRFMHLGKSPWEKGRDISAPADNSMLPGSISGLLPWRIRSAGTAARHVVFLGF